MGPTAFATVAVSEHAPERRQFSISAQPKVVMGSA